MVEATSSSGAERKDVWAFAATIAFAVAMYTVPAEWIPGFATLRPALVTSGLAIALTLVRRLGMRERFHFDGVRGLALIALTALGFISIGWSINPAASKGEWGELVKLALFYFVVVNVVSTAKRLEALCLAILISSIVTSVGTIHWYLGGQDLVEGYRARWYGVYADPNRMAMNLLICVPIAASFLNKKGIAWPWKAVALVAGALATICIVISHSRAGGIGLAIAMAIWALREKQRMRSIILGIVLLAGIAVFAPKTFWQREETVGDFHDDVSAMGRVYGWNIASKISIDRPLTGVGLGSFRYSWPIYAPAEAIAHYKDGLVSHDLFLDVLGELGWMGLFLFLIFAGGASGSAFESSRDKEVGWLARALAASVAGYLITQLSAGYLLSSHLYLLFGMAAAARRIAESRFEAIEVVKNDATGTPVMAKVIDSEG